MNGTEPPRRFQGGAVICSSPSHRLATAFAEIDDLWHATKVLSARVHLLEQEQRHCPLPTEKNGLPGEDEAGRFESEQT
jgi:hypothetical protein